MNNQKTNSYGKLLVFFLVAVIIVLSFGFVADGLQDGKVPDENSGNTDNDDKVSGDADNDNKNDEKEETNEPEIYIPEYVSSLTGLETTEQLATRTPIAITLSSSSALYGISSADILIEIPTENGESRFLFLTDDYKSLGKIGAVAPTRSYISRLSDSFGSILVSYGSDNEKTTASNKNSTAHFDLTVYSGSHYTEYNSYVYTNGDLINRGIANAGIVDSDTVTTLPFCFSSFGADTILGSEKATTISLPYGQTTSTELIYSESDKSYSIAKSGVAVHDMLNDKTPNFENVFILFADSTTYESKDGSYLNLHTDGAGEGYYISEGTVQKITWNASDGGNIKFFSESGYALTVNRGRSYIGFLKSSLHSENLIK